MYELKAPRTRDMYTWKIHAFHFASNNMGTVTVHTPEPVLQIHRMVQRRCDLDLVRTHMKYILPLDPTRGFDDLNQ